MSQRTAAWENRAEAKHQENRKQFEADMAEARKSVEAAQAAFDAQLDKIEESVSSQWRKVQKSFDDQVEIARSKVAERKAAHNLADAKERADYFEAYAKVAAEFASLAASEADAAMLQAIEARAYAISLEVVPA
jgi:hypothetical protein